MASPFPDTVYLIIQNDMLYSMLCYIIQIFNLKVIAVTLKAGLPEVWKVIMEC